MNFLVSGYMFISVDVSIVDVDGGIYSCNVVFIINDQVNSWIIFDFLLVMFVVLGCVFFGGFDFDEGDEIMFCFNY